MAGLVQPHWIFYRAATIKALGPNGGMLVWAIRDCALKCDTPLTRILRQSIKGPIRKELASMLAWETNMRKLLWEKTFQNETQ
jgi:hypothetical protein